MKLYMHKASQSQNFIAVYGGVKYIYNYETSIYNPRIPNALCVWPDGDGSM